MRPRAVVLALLLLSSLGGVLAYQGSARRSSTLTVRAATTEAETARVIVERAGPGGPETLTLAVHDTGGKEFPYVVGLPAGPVRAVRISPLGAEGTYEVRSLSLEIGAVGYRWDGDGCSRLTRDRGAGRREPCPEGSPAVAAAADGSLAISAVPDAGFDRPRGARLAIALGASLALLLGGGWLLRPPLPGPRGWAARALWLAVAAVYAHQFWHVWHNAVDVPAMDEWDYFLPGGLPEGFSPAWLFSRHNEHLLVPTHLLMWLNLKLLGLDYAFQKIANFLLFGGLLAAIAAFANRVAGRGRFALFPAFLLFLLSPIAYENHSWAFQSQFHLVLLFSVLALLPAFAGRPSVGRELAFAGLCVLAVFSFSAGVVLAAVFLLCRAARLAGGCDPGRANGAGCGREARLLAASGAVVAGTIAFWARGYAPKGDAAGPGAFLDARFWDYFLNILSLGFGFTAPSLAPGLACLAAVTLPVLLLVARRETRWRDSTWRVLALTAGLLAVLGAIAAGRSDPALAMVAKSSRFSEIGALLIPTAALAWWLAARTPTRRGVALGLLWCACAFGYRDDWSPDIYRAVRQEDLATLACVERYFGGAGDGVCQGKSTPAAIERAKELNVKFTRQFAAAGR